MRSNRNSQSPVMAGAISKGLNRRRFLRGLGVTLALPMFEAGRAFGAQTEAAKLATTATGAPLRMAYVYAPNGVIQDSWWPKGEGRDFQFNRTMEALNPLKDHVQVIGGLDHANATAGRDGAGDHARANGTFLTGVRVKKTAGSDIHAGVSIDQVVAQQVGAQTRFASLELSCDGVRKSGNCDSGYSCAYQFNLAWSSPTTPVAPEPNPRLVFERLFGAGSAGERRESYTRRQRQQRSILDFVLEDARGLAGGLGSRDKAKLDEYLTSVREIEQRLERSEKFGSLPELASDTPRGIPSSYSEHLQLMFGMMALAFETDSTRVATLLMAHDGSNRDFSEIGVVEGHHHLSHHQGKEDMVEKIRKIDAYYIRQFAQFLEKLRQTKDVDGRSVLDNSMIVYGGGNADGNRHTHHNLPIILAGGGGGTLETGRFIKAGSAPASNLFLSLADRMGVSDLERFGDSTGRLANI